MRILISPNAFKHGATAAAAATAIARGLAASRCDGERIMRPIADGGDGTAELLVQHLGGHNRCATVGDPFGRPVEASFALLADRHTAVIEMAEASGLKRLRHDELDPLRAGSDGTGELIRSALDQGIGAITLCIGGSATVDGGAGILRALGARFLDGDGNDLPARPAALSALSRIDLAHIDGRLARTPLTVLCDVTNPLLGERGAAAVFGPQKGATAAAVPVLEAALQHFSRVVFEQTGVDIGRVPGGGAAGGVAAGLFGLLGAHLVDGADYFLTRIDFDGALAQVDVVITGEGSLDEQTPQGKGPWAVAQRAKARGAWVVGLAGQVPAAPSPLLRSGFDVLLPIGNRAMSLAEALAATVDNLERTACELGNLLAWAAARQDASVLSSATTAPTR